MRTAHPYLALTSVLMLVPGLLLNGHLLFQTGISLLMVSAFFTYVIAPRNPDVYGDWPPIHVALKRLWTKYTS